MAKLKSINYYDFTYLVDVPLGINLSIIEGKKGE